MKFNEDKLHLLTFGNISNDSVSVKICSSTINISFKEKLLGAVLDSKSTFEQNIGNLQYVKRSVTNSMLYHV